MTIVVGGGPAGLMAAEALVARGCEVQLYDAMPSVGRKFLLAGKGGLNLTHSEGLEKLLGRFSNPAMEPYLRAFAPEAIREWAQGLGVETFVGTSGRVFPTEMKAAPLLRAWLSRLRASGVRFFARHRWTGWNEGRLRFQTPDGSLEVEAQATILALGGASWPRLGSNAAWVPLLERLDQTPLRPANCGFEVAWSETFRSRFAGQPLKSIEATHAGTRLRGELVVTEHGLEGSLLYALGRGLREELETRGRALLELDLAPDRSPEQLAKALAAPRGSRSMSEHLRRRIGIEGVRAGLLREGGPLDDVVQRIKRLPLELRATRPIEEAISTAGGVRFEALDERLMARREPGLFLAGEMLDWEAPTGGYLLTGCLATGRAAGLGAADWLMSPEASAR